MSSVISPLFSCGFSHQIAEHIIIHSCKLLAENHTIKDNQSCKPDYIQLVTTPTGLKNVIGWVIDIGILVRN
jgi:hypothetical protein